MKVLLVDPEAELGTAEKAVLCLLPALPAVGCERFAEECYQREMLAAMLRSVRVQAHV
ncbi:MAG: hypothetical protein R2748_27570 [Bryobacterales bacterium]